MHLDFLNFVVSMKRYSSITQNKTLIFLIFLLDSTLLFSSNVKRTKTSLSDLNIGFIFKVG